MSQSDNKNRGVSSRTIEVLRWIGEQYVVHLEHFGELLNRHPFTKNPLTYNTIKNLAFRWEQAGFIQKKKLLGDRPTYIWLTSYGYQVTDLPYKYAQPTAGRAIHKDWVNAHRLILEEHFGNRLQWHSERSLDPDQYLHLPDAIVILDGAEVALEIELHPKEKTRLQGILLDLTQDFEYVTYFCSHQTYALVDRLVQEIDPNQQQITVERLLPSTSH